MRASGRVGHDIASKANLASGRMMRYLSPCRNAGDLQSPAASEDGKADCRNLTECFDLFRDKRMIIIGVQGGAADDEAIIVGNCPATGHGCTIIGGADYVDINIRKMSADCRPIHRTAGPHSTLSATLAAVAGIALHQQQSRHGPRSAGQLDQIGRRQHPFGQICQLFCMKCPKVPQHQMPDEDVRHIFDLLLKRAETQ